MNQPGNKCCDVLRVSLGGGEKHYSNKTTAKENGKEVKIIKSNPNETLCRIHTEEVLKDINSRKCDFVFVLCDRPEFYFVELKASGVKVSDAYEQLEITINHFRQALGNAMVRRENIVGVIVGGRKKRLSDNNELRDLKYKFRKLGKELRLNSQFEEIKV